MFENTSDNIDEVVSSIANHKWEDFDRKVFALLTVNLSPGEMIRYYPSIKTPNFNLRYDIGLLNGLKALGIDKPIYVECRVTLLSSTFQEVINRFEKGLKYEKNAIFILVYDDSRGGMSVKRKNPHFKFYGFSELAHIVVAGKKQLGIDSIPRNNEKYANWEEIRDQRLEDLKEKLISQKCTPCLGAGVSMDAGIPSWDDLLKNLLIKAKKIKSIKNAEDQYQTILESNNQSRLIAARIILSKIDKKDHLRYIRDALYKRYNDNIFEKSKGELINALAELFIIRNVEQIITFNFDTLLENKIKKKGGKCMSIFGKEIVGKGIIPIYHVHGIIKSKPDPNEDNPKNIWLRPVLSEEEYHKLYGHFHSWSNSVTLNALDNSICILIGLSLTDPNLRRLLDISKEDKAKTKTHFVFMGRNNKLDKNNYYEIQEDILNSLGLEVIWYNIIESNDSKSGIKKEDHSELLSLIYKLK